MREKLLLLFLPIAAMAMVACAQRDEPYAGFIASDSAGVRIATNDIPVAKLSTIITVDSTAVQIGAESGEEPYLFNRIIDVARLESGHIAVVDNSQEIRIFDSSGKHVVTHGGKGQGPGQFNVVGAIIAQRGDTLLVWDNQAMRYATITVSGGYVDRTMSQRKNLSDLLVRDYFWERMYPAV